jgi:hypothetical protein
MSDTLEILKASTSDAKPTEPSTSYISGIIGPYRVPFVNYTPYNLFSPLNYGYYTDLNKDKTVIKTVVKYFYYKIIDKWLYSDLLPILGFVNVHDGKAKLIKDLDDYKNTNDSVENIEHKINLLSDAFISKEMVKTVLKSIVSKYNIKWYLLYKHQNLVKKRFFKYIKEELEDIIENK